MAPEQVKVEIDRIGPATDLYALGVILLEMPTGRTPYRGAVGIVMGQILAAPVPPVSEFRPSVNSRLDAVCRKAMAKEIQDRFPSMKEFAAAAEESLWLKSVSTVTKAPPQKLTVSKVSLTRKESRPESRRVRHRTVVSAPLEWERSQNGTCR